VNGGPEFTHVSLDDWRIVAANLAGSNRSTADRLISYTLFIDPELRRIGMMETEAHRQGRRIRVASLPAAAVPRAVTSGETRGVLKAVVDADSQLPRAKAPGLVPGATSPKAGIRDVTRKRVPAY
jgi:pyruvate/2-oxoglutarate dehydrogenase complex dihydrolipoamide dehydrogenase (E3) component